jgi:predicted RND superfamily exporter protein
MRSTGQPVAMSALTVLIGFGGLLTSFHPGLRSIGVLAVLGVGATLVASLTLLPSIIQVVEDFHRRRKTRRRLRTLTHLPALFPQWEEESSPT